MLRSLDTSVKPKTLSPRVLESHAPCWEIPRDPEPPGGIPGACIPLGSTAQATGAAEAEAETKPARLAAAQQRCSICMESFVAGERVRRLPCKPVRLKPHWSTAAPPAGHRTRGLPVCFSATPRGPTRRALAPWRPKWAVAALCCLSSVAGFAAF